MKRYFWFGFDFFGGMYFQNLRKSIGHVMATSGFSFVRGWLVSLVLGSFEENGHVLPGREAHVTHVQILFSVIYDENISSLILAFGYFSQWFLASGLGMCVHVCVFSPWDLLCSNGSPASWWLSVFSF